MHVKTWLWLRDLKCSSLLGEMMEITPLELKDEKEEYTWALRRLGIRSEGSWCSLQIWTFLRTTALQEYSVTQKNQLDCIPAHSVQIINKKVMTLECIFYSCLSPFLLSFVRCSVLTSVFSGSCYFSECSTWVQMPRSNQRERRGSVEPITMLERENWQTRSRRD